MVAKLFQTLERVFHPISKHLEVVINNPIAARFFNSLFGVRKSDECFIIVDVAITIETMELH